MPKLLFTPTRFGDLDLANRIVMAPMTRNRADTDGTPNTLMAEYYAQRAGAGLIVAEGAWPSPAGQAYCRQPGIATPTHIAGWRAVTDAVHAARRLASCCRSCTPGASAATGSRLRASTPCRRRPAGPGRDLDRRRGHAALRHAARAEHRRGARRGPEHAQAARRMRVSAGFDGVELHGTSGYLAMQFLFVGTNQRSDVYGGSRGPGPFCGRVPAGDGGAIGAGRVGCA
jgi:N-ethylmaleimide reductase